MIACKSRGRNRQYKEEGRISLFYSSYVFVFTCMHFVCSLYASPTAYIFVSSVLRTRLFAFLYALYAVNSGVVFSHSMHSRFFDAYNAYRFFDRPSRQRSRRNGRFAYTPAGAHDKRETRMGRDGGGQSDRRAVKARKSLLSAITNSKKSFMVRRGMPENANRKKDCPQTRTVEDRRTDNMKKK